MGRRLSVSNREAGADCERGELIGPLRPVRQSEHPCPSTGLATGPCPGYRKDAHAVVGFAQEKFMIGGIGGCAPESQVRIGPSAGAKEIRTAGPILVFIDRGGRFETNTDGSALVVLGAFAGDPPHDPRGPISPPSVPP
jgi:hypothetical protein